MFPSNIEGDIRWATFVYPREDVLNLHDWQHAIKQEEAKPIDNKPTSRGSGAKGNGSSAAETSPSSSKKPMAAKADQRTRRSSRIRRAKVPSSLWGFLKNPTEDNNDDFSLTDVSFDEQLAAELHCLYGVRKMDPPLVLDRQGRVWRRDHDRLAPKKRRRSSRAGDKGRKVEEDDEMRYESVEPEYAGGSTQSMPAANGSLRHDGAEDVDMHFVNTANGAHGHDDEDNDGDGFLYGSGEDDTDEFDLCQWARLGSRNGVAGYRDLRSRAKEKIYDVGRYSYENAYGPFLPFRATDAPLSRRHGVTPEGFPMHLAERLPLFAAVDMDDSGEAHLSDDDDSIGSGPGPDDPVVEIEEDEVEDLRRDREEAGDASPATSTGLASPRLINIDEIVEDGDEDENDDDDDDDDSSQGFPFFDDNSRADRFAQMVQEVAAYSGSKVRNTVERIRRLEAGEDPDKPNARPLWQSQPRKRSLVWQRQRSIDWVLLEAIMIAVHCSLTSAIATMFWGRGFKLPHGARGDSANGYSGRDACVHLRSRRLIEPPCGWHLSRGEEQGSSTGAKNSGVQTHDDDSGIVLEAPLQPQPQSTGSEKPFDWARAETSTWVGTYFFSDYPMFLRYNASLAQDPTALQNGVSLMRHEEAVGDCLQLRLELNPMERQSAQFEEGEEEALSNGPEDPEFPTLRFTGHTLTHHEEEPPQMRGRAHGYVRPVYATDGALTRFHAPTGQWLPEVAGVHWRITHAYDGQDRWSLSGAQAGPPGTRAPIYGIWSDVEDEEASPVGPFCYMNVDSRPWREVERLLREEEESEERRNRAMGRQRGNGAAQRGDGNVLV